MTLGRLQAGAYVGTAYVRAGRHVVSQDVRNRENSNISRLPLWALTCHTNCDEPPPSQNIELLLFQAACFPERRPTPPMLRLCIFKNVHDSELRVLRCEMT